MLAVMKSMNAKPPIAIRGRTSSAGELGWLYMMPVKMKMMMIGESKSIFASGALITDRSPIIVIAEPHSDMRGSFCSMNSADFFGSNFFEDLVWDVVAAAVDGFAPLKSPV